MNEALNAGRVIMPPASVASTATATLNFDTLGYDYLVADFTYGTQSTTDAALTVLKWAEGDTTSSYADIVAFTGGTATSTSVGYVIPAVTVSGLGGGIQFQMDLRKRKRYLKLSFTPGTAVVAGCVVTMTRPEISKLTAASKSVSNISATNAAVNLLVNG